VLKPEALTRFLYRRTRY